MKEIVLALAESMKFGLQFINTKESRKYRDEIIQIEKDLDSEYLQDEKYRDDLHILKLQRSLLNINSAIAKLPITASESGG